MRFNNVRTKSLKKKKKTYSESDVGDRKEEEEWEEEVFDLHGQQFGAEFVSVATWIYKYIVRNLRGTWQFDKVLRGGSDLVRRGDWGCVTCY